MSNFTTPDQDQLDSKTDETASHAVVVIGRNEGDRLIECLESLVAQAACLVYVDSGSTDSSCDSARQLGADVVNLDMSSPFTAARARNAGFKQVLKVAPTVESVMFVDGDCVIADGFLKAGMAKLRAHEKLAVVVGRLREQYPERSIYNRLCDMEWVRAVGPITTCGGNALIRVTAFQEVGGYREELIAGEEPELCVRLAKLGWTMECIDVDMGYHDAKMTRFWQWWKRTTRCGHAFAEGFTLHGKGPSRHNAKQLKSVLFWGLLLPICSMCSLAAALFLPSLTNSFVLLALAWPIGWTLLVIRVFRFRRSLGDPTPQAALYSVFCVLAKLPSAIGAVKFFWLRSIGKRRAIIEF